MTGWEMQGEPHASHSSVPNLLLQPSWSQGHGSMVPFAGWGTVALDKSYVQTYPCPAPADTVFWRVPVK